MVIEQSFCNLHVILAVISFVHNTKMYYFIDLLSFFLNNAFKNLFTFIKNNCINEDHEN